MTTALCNGEHLNYVRMELQIDRCRFDEKHTCAYNSKQAECEFRVMNKIVTILKRD